MTVAGPGAGWARKALAPQVVKATELRERAARTERFFQGWRAVLQQVDRIVAGRSLSVVMASGIAAPAWSDGTNIYLSKDFMQQSKDLMTAGNLSIEDFVLSLKGLNYHELAHLLFTPRAQEEPTSTIQTLDSSSHVGLWRVYNLLEDQRIESLFTTMYRPSIPYFAAAVTRYLLSNKVSQQELSQVFVLVHGRKYLPASLRRAASRAYKESGRDPQPVAHIIDKYRRLVLPDDAAEAVRLAKDLWDVLQGSTQPVSTEIPDYKCGGTGHGAQTGRSAGVQKQRAVAERRDKEEEADDDSDVSDAAGNAADNAEDADDKGAANSRGGGESDAEDGDTGKSAGEASDGETGDVPVVSDGDCGDSDDEHAGDGSPAKNDGKGSKDEDGSSDGKSGSGGLSGAEPDWEDVRAEAERLREDITADVNVQQDIERTVRSARRISEPPKVDRSKGRLSKEAATSFWPPTSKHRQTVHKVVEVIKTLCTDLEPSWVGEQTSGRPDFRRTMGPNGGQRLDIFRRWEPGNEEAASIEVVLLVDQSDSMLPMRSDLAETCWIIAQAMRRLNIALTIYGYSTRATMLLQAHERVPDDSIPYVATGGGTDPYYALKSAADVLQRSKAANRILISVTDGMWLGDVTRSESIVAMLDRQGINTLLLGLVGAVSSYGPHAHRHAADISQPQEIVTALKALVVSILRRHRRV